MEQERKEFNGFRAFWQLLGTLVLVAVVGAVFYPIFAPATGSGRSPASRCLSNAKQLTTATIIYCADSDDTFPPYYSFESQAKQSQFYDAIMPYSKNPDTFRCPAEEPKIKNKQAKASQEGIAGKMSYVHSLSLKGVIPNFASGNRILKEGAAFTNPAKAAYLRDPIRGYGLGKGSKVNGYLSPHGGSFIVSFCDSHAKILTPIEEEL